MKKSIIAATAAAMMLAGCSAPASAPAETPAAPVEEVSAIDAAREQLKAFNATQESWMTVANGHWNSDPAVQISDEDLNLAFETMAKCQNAVQWTPWYFIAVKDAEEQQKILGDYWAAPEEEANEGTVTILVLADQILSPEDGHASEYGGYYMPTNFAYYDAGLASGLFQFAVESLGYKTHYFGTVTGEYAPTDVAGKYQSMNRYVSPEDIRTWGFSSTVDGDIETTSKYPVDGNCVFVCAIVVGVPAEGEEIATWGTNHGRPANYKIWDGTVYNETAAPAGEALDIELGENQYLGEANGQDGTVSVVITVEDGKLTKVEVVPHQETEGVGTQAVEELPAKIVEAQSTDVDVVAGATVTSEAIKKAVDAAMKEAGL